MHNLQVTYKQRMAQKVPQGKNATATKAQQDAGSAPAPLRHKYWLQRNRIDAHDVCPNVGVMKQIKLTEKIETGSTPLIHCQHCGGLTRLIGSESHPVQDNTDLLTYVCMDCDEFLVLPIESGARI